MDDIDDLLDNVDDQKDEDFNIKDYNDTVESEDSASYEELNDNVNHYYQLINLFK